MDPNPYCLDFTKWLKNTTVKECDLATHTIPELVYLKANSDRVAAVFDSEKVSLTFKKIAVEMDTLAAGLLSIGLVQGDRILICGSNHSQVLISALASSRAGLVFALANPNFPDADTFHRYLSMGDFRAVICFKAANQVDYLYNLLLKIVPEMIRSHKGHIQSANLAKLTHVILAEEDHKHAGSYTLSEVFGRCSPEKKAKLPAFEKWNSAQLACFNFTMGSHGPSRLVGISHEQLLNGARAAVTAFKLHKEQVIACALPLFRLPLFSLAAIAPFLIECRVVFPEPSPLPRNLFSSITKYQKYQRVLAHVGFAPLVNMYIVPFISKCTTLLSNGVALRLLLKMAKTQRAKLGSINRILMIGERVSNELMEQIKDMCVNVQLIAVGYLLSETGSIPIMGDATTDFTKNVGKPIAGYQAELSPLRGTGPVPAGHLGQLRVRAFDGTRFLGYAPSLDENGNEWIDTGDVARIDAGGRIEIVSHIDDIVYNKLGHIIEHWNVERALNQSDVLKGVQVINKAPGDPVTAVCILKPTDSHLAIIKSDLINLCKCNGAAVPEKFGFVDDFPRVATKIQKYKLRQMLREGSIPLM